MLEASLAEFPGFHGLVLPYASALLALGTSAADVVAQVEQRVEAMTATVRFMLGTALIERGEIAAAVEQFEAVIAQQPGSARGHVALADALLSDRRWDEAAATAAAARRRRPAGADGAPQRAVRAARRRPTSTTPAALLARDVELPRPGRPRAVGTLAWRSRAAAPASADRRTPLTGAPSVTAAWT